ncbi:MAG TPA: HAD family hydrolase [Ktedonobacterales bacterium]|jgi:putative hydrolase of the HAD superfamily|nr:HAD family hydrolase [Ktedonobacterales bacterium]HEX5572473.1 HAD family hydrolase [Ktedonobacterales bacterium]
MRQAVFFDLDDTLCDAAPAFAAGRRSAFQWALFGAPELSMTALERAWALAHAELAPQLEAGALTMAEVRELRFQRTLALAGVPDPDGALADKLDDLLGATQLSLLRPFGDVAALDALRERGVFVGIVTNGADDAARDSQRTKAAHLGLLDRLDGFWVSDTTGYRKPDPRAFALALAAAGCAAERCLYVGDSLANDIAGANAAGMRSVLLRRETPDVAADATPADQPQSWRVIRSLWETLDLLDLLDP